ncbi:MAG: response regulator transcription factor [Clostridia bacterium]|nr:response regulator transcription factor [Clostridia bacterium]
MNIAIVEDLQEDRQHLEALLRNYAAINGLDMEFQHFISAEELLRNYRPMRYSIIFMDIYLGGMTGIEAAEEIRKTDNDVVLIFATTSRAHIADAMHAFATSYIMKPCDMKELFRTLDFVLRRKTETEVRRLAFVSEKREHSLKLSEILAMESDGNYLTIVGTGGIYRVRMTMAAAQSSLDDRFLLILKGIIVNLDYVADIVDGQCVMADGHRYPINVKKHREIRQIWQNYIFNKTRNESSSGGVQVW